VRDKSRARWHRRHQEAVRRPIAFTVKSQSLRLTSRTTKLPLWCVVFAPWGTMMAAAYVMKATDANRSTFAERARLQRAEATACTATPQRTRARHTRRRGPAFTSHCATATWVRSAAGRRPVGGRSAAGSTASSAVRVSFGRLRRLCAAACAGGLGVRAAARSPAVTVTVDLAVAARLIAIACYPSSRRRQS